MKSFHRLLAGSIAALLHASPAVAITDTWDGNSPNAGAGDSLIFTGLNWADDTAPLSDLVNTDLLFAGTTKLAPNFSPVFSANSIGFTNTAGAFVLAGSTVNIGAGGIVNLDTQLQTFGNAVTLGTATSIFSSTNGALAFSTINLGTNALTWTGTGAGTNTVATFNGTGSVTRNAGNLTYGAAGAVSQAWDLAATNGATVSSNAATDLTVSTTGSITVSGSTFNANGNVTMNGTALLLSGPSSALTVAAGKTLTVQNGGSLVGNSSPISHNTAGTIVVTGSGSLVDAGVNNLFVSGSGSTVNVLAGADATFSGLVVGSPTTATALFDGAGTSATGFAGGSSAIGNGGVGAVTFRNGAVGTLGLLNLATSANSNGQLNIQSGAAVTATSLLMVDDALVGELGALTINGAGSSFTIATTGTMQVGAGSLSFGEVAVQSGGAFHTGTGVATVNTTGTIVIAGGTFIANGDLTLNGGQLTRDAAGIFNVVANRTLTVLGGGDVTITGGQLFTGAMAFNVSGVGSTFTTSGTGSSLIFASGVNGNVTAGGSVSVGSQFTLGGTGSGTFTVDGVGSQLTAASALLGGGFTGTLIASNSATAALGTLSIAASAAPGSGTLHVLSGADATAGAINLGNGPAAVTGNILISGAGSSLSQIGVVPLAIGSASAVQAKLRVESGGIFNSGTGATTVVGPGVIEIVNGTFNANGNLTLSAGAQLTKDSAGTFNLATNRTLTIQTGADATFGSQYNPATAGTINITGSGSTMTAGSLTNGANSTINVSAGGQLIVENGASIANSLGDGTLTATGAGTTISAGTGLTFRVGNNSNTGAIALSNLASLSVGILYIAESDSTTGSVTVASGADVSVASVLRMATLPSAVATLTLTGGGTTLTQTTAFDNNLGRAGTGSATIEVTDGATLTTGTGRTTLEDTATVNITAGTVNFRGPLVRAGGVLNFNSGALAIVDDFTVGTGGLLGASFTADATRSFATTGTTTIDAFRTLTIDGGTFSTGALVSNGTLAFQKGTLGITGAGGFEIGTGALGANVTLATGATLAVTNTATVASGASLSVEGGVVTAGALVNAGLIEHARGTLNVAGAVTNQSGADFFAARPVTIGGVFTNQSGARLTLEEGTGRIHGAGSVSNAGLIRGDGTFAVPVTNNAGGELRAELGKTLRFLAPNAPNAGLISLQNGTLEFAGAVTNAAGGFITGRGALHTASLVNQGVLAFSGGNADVFGDVTNAAGARIVTSGAGATTTFYDDVIHNGVEIFTGPGGSTVFFGEQSGAGSFTGTGTVYYIGDLRPGNSPAEVIYEGDLLFGSASSLTLEIGGLTPGREYDRLDIAGTLFADGVLKVTLLDGFTPASGDTFDFFDAGALVGAFDAIELPALGTGLAWDAAQIASTGQAAVVPEPGIGALLLAGAAFLGLRRRQP